ncbi:hypothetical protein BGW38_007495, partial [Lunasporangiospora selenospora]
MQPTPTSTTSAPVPMPAAAPASTLATSTTAASTAAPVGATTGPAATLVTATAPTAPTAASGALAPHEDYRLTDEQILTQMQAIKDEEAMAHPLVDESMDLMDLEKEYENGSAAFRNKILNLADSHDRMRRSRGDAFAFAWFERVMLAKSKPELLAQAIKAIEESKDLLLAAQFEPLAFDDFYAVTLETVQNLPTTTSEQLL